MTLKTRRKLTARLTKNFLGKRIAERIFNSLVRSVMYGLPSTFRTSETSLKQAGAPERAVRETLRELVGSILTADLLTRLCWRLAGNLDLLKRGYRVPVWQNLASLEWVPVQITRVRLCRGGKRGSELGHEVTALILGGRPAGLTTVQWWSLRKSRFLSRYRDKRKHCFGFSRPPRRSDRSAPKYPYADARQYVGMRFWACIDPEIDPESPSYKELCFNAATTEWNQLLLQRRARLTPEYACPYKFPLTHHCHRCPIGLEHCLAAVHPKTFVYRECPRCKVAEAPFDPASPTTKFCVTCVEQRVRAGEE